MKVQSLSIVVPTHNKCVNSCKFCVSRTHTNPYDDRITEIANSIVEHDYLANEKIELQDYFNRLQYARDNGCNVVVLTGTGEPIQNMKFLEFFSGINLELESPFKNIELQTTGVMLNNNTLPHLRRQGITTISFSISNIFDNERNMELIGCPKKLKFDLFETIKLVKSYGFNLRLSLNLVNDYDNCSVDEVVDKCKDLGADQVTFRKLYKSALNNEIDKWIEENASVTFYDNLTTYVKENGRFLGTLPFGPTVYDIKEMSFVIDDDCMNEQPKDAYKYLILRENCKLYTRWDLKSSLIF